MDTDLDVDLALIRTALEAMPSQCRYHHDRTEPDVHTWRREACCDSGVPAQRRRLAEEALQRLAHPQPQPAPDFVEQYTDPDLIGTETKGPDLH